MEEREYWEEGQAERLQEIIAYQREEYHWRLYNEYITKERVREILALIGELIYIQHKNGMD